MEQRLGATSLGARLARTTHLLVSSLVLVFALAGAAYGQTLPSMRFERADLVSPSAAETFYGSSTTRTSSFTGVSGFEGRPPEIVEQARALNNDPDQIFEYVRNNIEIEWAFGARKGALGALIDRSGTAFDLNILFVELVREAGFSARYRIATITLTDDEFEAWTGVSNATAACRLLAYAGIPAAFDGDSPADCDVGATFDEVELRHIWSEVQIGGTWYAFDPSFKPHDFAAQRNLVSGSGFSSGQPATQAANGLTTGTISGQEFIRDVNTGALDAYLEARAEQLLSDLETNAPAANMRGVIGGPQIIPVYEPPGGFRDTSPPYPASDVLTITGDIPDQYRTGMEISATVPFGSFSRQLWVDEIYGRRLEFDSNFDAEHITAPGDYFNVSFRLELDDVALNTVTHANTLPSYAYTATIEITHPYAAASGGYADQTITGTGYGAVPVAIVHGWGQVSPNLGAVWARERAEDEALPNRVAGQYQCGDIEWLCNPEYPSPAGDMSRQRTAAAYLAQISQMMAMQGAVGNAQVLQHHTVGFVQWSYTWQTFAIGPTGPFDFGVSDQQLILFFHSAVSVISEVNDAPRERAVSRSIALSAATLEGGIVEQQQDLPDAVSTAARFGWGNAPDNEDPCNAGARRFFDFTGASYSTLDSLILFEGAANGCTASNPIDNGQRQFVRSATFGSIDQYLDAGFSVYGSQESFLGPGARLGGMQSDTVCAAGPGSCTTITSFSPSLHRGGAFIANRFAGNGDVLEIAHVVIVGGEIAKGGGGAQPPTTATTFDPRRAADALRDRFIDRSSVLGVNLNAGTVGYSTGSLLSAGAGESAPYRLDYSLTYQAGPRCTGTFGPCTGAPQAGWTHNWSISFTLGGSGLEAMGATSPLAATDSIIAFMAMQDMFLQTGIDDLDRDVFAAMVADWWRRRMVGNVATLTRGFQGQQYVRQSDDTWLAPVGAPGELTQTGARTKVRDQCSPDPNALNVPASARRWDFASVSFSLRNAAGDVMEFEPWSSGYSLNECAIVYGFELTSWTWPQGPSLSFETSYGVPNEVTSSLGRTLQVGEYAAIGGRSAGFTGDPNEITDAAGATWTYEFTAPVARSATQRPRPFAQLYRVYEPVNPSEPALQYTYDSRGLILEARDAEALQASRDPHVFFIAPGARGQRLDPAGGRFTVYYNTDNDAVRFIDEIGRLYTAAYDGRHRVIERIYPQGDSDEFTYDARDNVLTLTRNPTTGSPLSPITLTATYNATWNGLASLTDGRGNTTSFTYHNSGNGMGLLATAVRPTIGGQSPTYTFTYNSIGLVIEEEDPTGVTTEHTYNSYGDRLTTTAGAASANGQPALNLTTTFTPDSWGDVVAVVAPRGNASTTTFDTMRRPTVVRRHDGGTGANLIGAERTTYDALGRVTEVEGATAFSGTTVTAWQTREERTYTPTGQVATVTNGAGNVTTNAYDPMDRLLSVTDPVGRITRNEYDLAGQLTRIMRAYGTGLQQDYARYTYTPNGWRASVRDANDNRSAFVYDGFGRLCRLYFPVATVGSNQANTGGVAENALTCASGGTNPDYEGYAYDANNNRTDLRLRSGETISFSYDVLDRMSVKDIPGSSTTDVYFAYDLAGRRLSARFQSTSGDGILYSYDAMGRLLTEQAFGRTLAFQYDPNSNRTRITWPDSNYVTYTYDNADRVDLIRESGATTLLDYAYDNLGRRIGTTRGDATTTTYDYDNADRLTDLDHDLGNAATNQTYGFSYTAASQLAQRTAANDNYNWITPAASVSYTRNGLNQYTAVGGASFTYDARGNLTSDGTRTFSYDLENHLTSVSGGPANMTLSYDPLGRLYQTTSGGVTTTFLYDGDRLVAEYNGATLQRRYVHGPGVDEPVLQYEGTNFADRRYLIADHLGSIIAENGATSASQYRYGPYGEPSSWTGSRFRYTGQIALPEAQLYHYKARVYDPILGRFLQTDPIGYEDDLNLYAYVASDPLVRSDPTGTYGRGEGFTNDQWRDFNRAQQRAANQADRAAGRLEQAANEVAAGGELSGAARATIRDFEQTTGGAGTVENLGAAAQIFRGTVAVLRDDGSGGHIATGLSAAQWSGAGHPATAMAHVLIGGPNIDVNLGHQAWGNATMSTWAVGHDSMHNLGLEDQVLNGALAYRFGGPLEQQAWQELPNVDPARAMVNPDNLLNFAQ